MEIKPAGKWAARRPLLLVILILIFRFLDFPVECPIIIWDIKSRERECSLATMVARRSDEQRDKTFNGAFSWHVNVNAANTNVPGQTQSHQVALSRTQSHPVCQSRFHQQRRFHCKCYKALLHKCLGHRP
jgi:hypothetical protein